MTLFLTTACNLRRTYCYASSGDPVTAVMAAQVLCLRALSLGTGLNGTRAKRAAKALTTGRALHFERAPSWSH